MKLTPFTIGLLAISSTTCFAFVCPTNFTQVDFGNTLQQITEKCGKPDREESKEVEIDSTPQEWNYFVGQRPTTGPSSYLGAQGRMKVQFVFDGTGSLIDISMNGVSTGSTPVCGNVISLGASKEQVKAACGDASFINKQTKDGSSTSDLPKKKITTYYYNTTPPVKLIFENGVLKEKQ